MTEHDTPSTAHTEAWAFVESVPRDAWYVVDAQDGFDAGYARALAQVREGLEAVPEHRARQNTSYGYKEVTIIERGDALAVVDRLEGKP